MTHGRKLSFLEYWSINVQTQWQLAIPILLLAYAVTTVFYTEIHSGILFLYKDLDKKLIFKAKVWSLIKILGIFTGLTFLVSLLSYYTLMLSQTYISGHLFPDNWSIIQMSLLTILSRLIIYVIVILLVSVLSSRYNNSISVLAGLFFMLLANVAPQLPLGRYFFPTGYVGTGMHFLFALILMCLVSSVYIVAAYALGLKKFEQIEF
ncbi:amino acid transporter [Streptococcus sp. 'caviae']|uniref:amino acid transporter n=1 Tax=Streptococcus sp. 'caviae' TaxID=1915004 RepID=UPI00214BEF4F|nr:amino acid transporter [Streptococcus sp. 'caviae']